MLTLEGVDRDGALADDKQVPKHPTGGTFAGVETRLDGGDAEQLPRSPSVVTNGNTALASRARGRGVDEGVDVHAHIRFGLQN